MDLSKTGVNVCWCWRSPIGTICGVSNQLICVVFVFVTACFDRAIDQVLQAMYVLNLSCDESSDRLLASEVLLCTF